MDARYAADVNPRQASEFHCPFGPSQLRRLGPKGPRNTSVEGALPRAARAFGAACPGLVCFALSALLPLRGLGSRAREWALAGLWRRRGLKARTTAGRRARLGPPVALPLNYQWLTDDLFVEVKSMRPTVIASFGYGQWSSGVYFLFMPTLVRHPRPVGYASATLL